MLWFLCQRDVFRCVLFLELAQGLDTDKINPYIEKCFGVKKPLLTVRKYGEILNHRSKEMKA